MKRPTEDERLRWYDLKWAFCRFEEQGVIKTFIVLDDGDHVQLRMPKQLDNSMSETIVWLLQRSIVEGHLDPDEYQGFKSNRLGVHVIADINSKTILSWRYEGLIIEIKEEEKTLG